jgi:hypothetical protein
VQDCQAELVKTTFEWSRVFRVTLFGQGHSARDSIIVKAINPEGWSNPLEGEREANFYRVLYPGLNIPRMKIHFVGTDPVSGWLVVLMQDLSMTHYIPSHPYQWTREELKSVLHAYTCLHTSEFTTLDYNWLLPRHETLVNFETIPEQVEMVQCAGTWGELPGLSELIAYARESCQKYAAERLTLLHGDTTPTNAPIPKSKDGIATLIDWQDVGVGMAEFDLAYLDLQPYESTRLIPRSELLSYYWRFRAQTDSTIPSDDERRARQLHADAITTLWLTAPASRVTLNPFPEGSPQQKHWQSQFGIVYNRLKEISREIK